MFQRKHTKQQSTKKKKKTLTNKHETTLNFECPTGISHLQPPLSRLLVPGVKPSCSTPFTPFLRLVSVYWPFQLYFIPKTLRNTSVFSSLLTANFYLTSHSPVFIYNTTLLHMLLLTLCGHLQTQRVCRALHPVSGEDGILVAEVPRGVQHASSARTSPRRVVGLARPNQSAGRALP